MRPILGSVLVLMVAWMSDYRLGIELITLWPSQWAFGVQVVLSILCITFMDYWQHRLFHAVDALWWFHALHHNPTQMHILKVARIHFADGAFGAIVIPLPLILFGAPKEIVLIATMWMVLSGRSVHANVDQRFPRWYHYVMPTVQVHNLHHSNIRQFQDSNYSTNLPLWDWIFGTLSHPHHCQLDKLGIKDDYVPTNFIKQLYAPFVWWFKSSAFENSTQKRT
jgi:sterol desaturase/sphingolipid hydroxylase (fatty acid hydroxylase superfamily)